MRSEPVEPEVPRDWDRLRNAPEDTEPDPFELEHDSKPDQPTRLALASSAWGDLVTVLAVSTAALLALAGLGYQNHLLTLPWALALGVVWWTAAAIALMVIRHAIPGMLMAGVSFDQAVPGARIPLVVLAACVQWCSVGAPALAGVRWNPLRLAAGTRVVAARRPPADLD